MRSLLSLTCLTAVACTDCPPASGDTGTIDTASATTPAVAPTRCAEVDRTRDGASEVPTDADEIMLSGVYRVSGTVTYDSDEEVTIEAGTVFLMEAGASVRFGWRSDPAAVFAEGTEEAPILFCGTEDTPGHWLGVELLTGTRVDSTLSHVVIEDAGLDDMPALSVMQPVDLVGVQLFDNAATGLYAESLGSGSSALVSTGNAVGLHLSNGETVTALPEGDYTGNGDDAVLVTHLDNEDVVFHDRGVPYRQTDERVVYGSADGDEVTVTYEAGVTYQMCQDCSIVYGFRSDPAVVLVQGTAAAPVRFTSAQPSPAPGDWDGLVLSTGTRSASRIEHAEISYGGKRGGEDANGANLIVSGGLGVVSNSHFADAAGYGVWLERVEPGFELTGATYEGNGEGDLYDATN